jgi:hypothetical protein
MRNIAPTFSPDARSLILLWAFAESGIGGMLHAFRLPFTGIFVGGLAIICIGLLGYYQEKGSRQILEALGIVLLVKLTISPHSPWQAYFAVVFQGYLGYLIFTSKHHFKAKVLIFSVLCMFESAFQKVIIASLILGNNFLKSVDQAAVAIANSLGLSANVSAVWLIFVCYVLIHIVLGMYLGLWIPKIPKQLTDLSENMPNFESSSSKYQKVTGSYRKVFVLGMMVFALVLVGLKYWLPHLHTIDLIFIFLRTLAVSLLLIFVVGPLIKKLIAAQSTDAKVDKRLLQDVMSDIPAFSQQAFDWLNYVRNNKTGFQMIKTFILGLLVISAKFKV